MVWILSKNWNRDRRFWTGNVTNGERNRYEKIVQWKELADAIWNKVGLEGTMPDEIFKVFMEKLYSENVKQGDRKTDERYVELFNKTLEEFGYIGK